MKPEYRTNQPVSCADAFVSAFSPDKDVGVLREAIKIVTGPRQKDYGHPHDDHSRVAKMWSAILGVEIPVDKVALCMIAVKVSRACNAPKRDNWVDMAGYAHVGHSVQKKMGLL